MRCINYEPVQLTNLQKQVIIGTILGGSSLVKSKGGKNFYLSMRDRNKDWLIFKTSNLLNISKQNITKDTSQRWHSKCHPILEDFSPFFYKNYVRHLNIEALNKLQDIGFAIWFGDCGKIINNKIILKTNIWGEKGTQTIAEYFNLIGYSGEIIKEKKWFRYELDKSSSLEFMHLAAPWLPSWFLVPKSFKMKL